MGFCFPEARLDYTPASRALFRHTTLLDELRDIRRHHSSPANQVIHFLTTVLFYAFVSTTLLLIFRWLTLPDPILVFLIILFFPVPYLGFFWYLDPFVAIFWFPFLIIAILVSILIANALTDLMPVYAVIPISALLACLAMAPQVVGHWLLEEKPLQKFHKTLMPFEMTVMTPFFIGYCGFGWMCCWYFRRDTTDQIWKEDEKIYMNPLGQIPHNGLEEC
ncbi:unnamed protein product [Calypogeia fissa]